MIAPAVYVGNTPVLAGADGYYHVPLSDAQGHSYVDNNDLNSLPYGVWTVKRTAGSFTAGNWGHQNNNPVAHAGYVSYNASATVS